MPPRPPKRPRAVNVEVLAERAGLLKRELVEFGRCGRFVADWEAFLGGTEVDGTDWIRVLDEFVLRHRLQNGSTVLEEFVADRRPPLRSEDRRMLRSWGDPVDGVFEVRGSRTGVTTRNLVDDLDYEVLATAGPAALEPMRPGTFAVGRIVPLGHGRPEWLLSGELQLLAQADRPTALQTALRFASSHPAAVARNPHLAERGRAIQAAQHAAFLAEAGAELIVVTPAEATDLLRRYFARVRDTARGAGAPSDRGIEPDLAATLPEELLDAETVGIVHDVQTGLSLLPDFGALEAWVAEPSRDDRRGSSLLRFYLEDDSFHASAVRHLARRHPRTIDAALRRAMGRPGLSWAEDGEALIAELKPPPRSTPAISVIGDRLTELLRSGDRSGPPS